MGSRLAPQDILPGLLQVSADGIIFCRGGQRCFDHRQSVVAAPHVEVNLCEVVRGHRVAGIDGQRLAIGLLRVLKFA